MEIVGEWRLGSITQRYPQSTGPRSTFSDFAHSSIYQYLSDIPVGLFALLPVEAVVHTGVDHVVLLLDALTLGLPAPGGSQSDAGVARQ